jgi:MscS family membrane protein
VNPLGLHPVLFQVLVSAAILVASAVAARILTWVFEVILGGLSRRTSTKVDDQLIRALRRPVTWALFLVGAYVAVHRLPIQDAWTARLDGALFVWAVFLLALGVARAYGTLVQWYTRESRLGVHDGLAREFGPLFAKLGKLFIVAVAIIISFDHFGLDARSLVVSLGVGSLAIGLAAQDTLSNMFAGFALMLDRPFAIGERIQLATGEVGDVENIGIRATRIRTIDETLLVVPNSSLVKERVVNLSRPGRHLVTKIDVGVAYGTDVGAAKRLLVESAQASSHVDPRLEPVAVVRQFGEYALNLRVSFWAKDYTTQGLAVDEVHEEVYRRFAEAGIEIAYPIRRILQEADPS